MTLNRNTHQFKFNIEHSSSMKILIILIFLVKWVLVNCKTFIKFEKIVVNNTQHYQYYASFQNLKNGSVLLNSTFIVLVDIEKELVSFLKIHFHSDLINFQFFSINIHFMLVKIMIWGGNMK